jgi:hypothetical protein
MSPSMAIFLEQYPHIVANVAVKKQTSDIILTNYDIAIGYENSAFFNDWCGYRIDKLRLYYPNMKPTPLKIKVYMDYLAQNWKGSAIFAKKLDKIS